ncbi:MULTISPECIES: VOC family protein [Dyella]|uniref:VOC family protein n=2 Tax=Dyella TaxID=231454 RepID=A0A4R0YMV5_9GAMM|nr:MULTISPECIES: VOC family protein [Dyella]TBR36216.1 VOC family protein [Dyella terrae]TCI05873.1 VOC family protein [Dyella soli]
MTQSVSTFLMFEGRAEEAMNFYVSLFDDGAVLTVERHPEGGPHAGTIKLASFHLRGHHLRCSDSTISHGFSFTPSISLFVECEDRAELERLFAQLSEGGQVYMPVGDYGFSEAFGWVGDRFGVTWQLNLSR